MTILLIVAISCMFFYANIYPIILEVASAKVLSLATGAVSNAVFYALTEKTDYNDLVTVFSDNAGKINMIQADSVKINTLAREISRLSQDAINKIGNEGIDIALGSLTGSPLLVGQGPMIHIKMLPIGKVNSDFYSEFQEAGINQTRHKIYINVVATVQIILPVADKVIETSTQVLVCESVLIGSVPNTYLKLSDKIPYNLLP